MYMLYKHIDVHMLYKHIDTCINILFEEKYNLNSV